MFLRAKANMVTLDEALPGRTREMPVTDRHTPPPGRSSPMTPTKLLIDQILVMFAIVLAGLCTQRE